MKRLHHLQSKLLQALRDVPEGGYSLGDLQKLIGATSKSQVVHHTAQLRKKGLLKDDPDDPNRFIVFGDEEAEDPFVFLPLMALASCGSGIGNEQHVIDRIPVRSTFIPAKVDDSFLVRAENDSMEPRIRDKDVVLVERYVDGRHRPDGKVVVCVEDGETKIKQYSESNGTRILLSFNQKYAPHVISPESSFEIVGVVRGVLFSSI